MNSWEGSACYPSGPNPAKRPLCPMPIFPIVSGPDFSCCWSFNLICQLQSYWEIPWPPKHLTLPISDITHTYFFHQDLKILRRLTSSWVLNTSKKEPYPSTHTMKGSCKGSHIPSWYAEHPCLWSTLSPKVSFQSIAPVQISKTLFSLRFFDSSLCVPKA